MQDLSGANGEQAAMHNRRVVLQAIRRHAPLSRTELAHHTGLTKQTVARIVERLLDEGLAMEARRRQGGRGQPAIEIEIDPDGTFSIGANIDRDHLTILAVDASGAVRGRIHHEERFIGPERFVALLGEALSSFRRRRIVDEARLAGIGLAVPDWLGEVDFPERPADYGRWTAFDVRVAVEALAPHPVFIANDANAAAMGELEHGLGAEFRSFFYVLFNACLGGGLVLDGRRHQGATGLSGEIGWLPVALERDKGRLQPLGEEVSLFMLYRFLAANGFEVREPAGLLALPEAGRALVSHWLASAAEKLAEAIHHIGLVVDPGAVLIGGRLPLSLIDELLRLVDAHLSGFGAEAPAVHRAAGSQDAAALGAAAMPLAERLMLGSAEPDFRTRIPFGTRDSRRLPHSAAGAP